MPEPGRRRTSYFYNPDFGGYYYGYSHPMKPSRITLTHELILAYDLHKSLDIFCPRDCTPSELAAFHSEDYLHFLRTVTPESVPTVPHDKMLLYNVGEESPLFSGVFDLCRTSAGGSVAGATMLAAGHSDAAINWMGGLHHAKASSASGFCYVNDIVLGILELLKVYERVLYIDIDIHHGDGVEEAFYTTDRVLTLSLHKHGQRFFPGTGHIMDVGAGLGRGYAVNVPLRSGMADDAYGAVFKPVLDEVMERFRPSVVVLQCGADSLANDRLGCFNLTLKGHGGCAELVRSYGLPTLVLGGGGYTVRNVARCWTYHTAVWTDSALRDRLPPMPGTYGACFGSEGLNVVPSNMDDLNAPGELHAKVAAIIDTLRAHVRPTNSHSSAGVAPPLSMDAEALVGRGVQADGRQDAATARDKPDFVSGRPDVSDDPRAGHIPDSGMVLSHDEAMA
jgi:histone deacetylase 1/2